jgi:hypothetical protein
MKIQDTSSLLRKWGLIDASSVELHVGFAPVREPRDEVNPARVSELHPYVRHAESLLKIKVDGDANPYCSETIEAVMANLHIEEFSIHLEYWWAHGAGGRYRSLS